MSASQISDSIKSKVETWMGPVFDYMDICLEKNEIVFDNANFCSDGFEATFYFRNIEKYKKNLFDEVSDFIFQDCGVPVICELKKKYKNENQRIYLKVGRNES